MIYKFVLISGEEESFIREFELDENNTLLDFHNTIQEEMEYDNSQIASFFTATDKWEKEEEFTLFDMGSNTSIMEDVAIDDVVINDGQKLLYIFDPFNERAFFIECIGEVDEIVGREYPICVQSHGLPPKQIIMSDFAGKDIEVEDLPDSKMNMADENDLPEFEDIDDFDDL